MNKEQILDLEESVKRTAQYRNKCVAACAGLNPEAVPELVKAVQAVNALADLCIYSGDKIEPTGSLMRNLKAISVKLKEDQP